MVVLSTVLKVTGAQFMQHNKYVAAHVDLLWDVTNFWAPYRESKVFRLIPWVGFGYAQRFKTTDDYRYSKNGVSYVERWYLNRFPFEQTC